MGTTAQVLLEGVTILLLAFAQNVSFSIVSRSRNRNNVRYHIIAAVGSYGMWFLTFRQLVLSQMTLWLFPFYCLSTVLGSVVGVQVSTVIERWLGATSDDQKNVAPKKHLHRGWHPL